MDDFYDPYAIHSKPQAQPQAHANNEPNSVVYVAPVNENRQYNPNEGIEMGVMPPQQDPFAVQAPRNDVEDALNIRRNNAGQYGDGVYGNPHADVPGYIQNANQDGPNRYNNPPAAHVAAVEIIRPRKPWGLATYELIMTYVKLVFHIIAIVFVSIIISTIVSKSRPIEDLSETWIRAPSNDVMVLMSDSGCPEGYVASGVIGKDRYEASSVRNGKRKRRTYQEDFREWKGAVFCFSAGNNKSMVTRDKMIDGVCPDGQIICSGMCFPSTQCPVTNISFSSSPDHIPVGDGKSWFHRGLFYTMSFERMVENSLDSSGGLPIIGVSSTITASVPPVKCIAEQEKGLFTHGTCSKPDSQYFFVDSYADVTQYYKDNGNQGYLHKNLSGEKAALFFRAEQGFIDTTCPLTQEDILNLKPHTTTVFGVAIALIIIIIVEFLIFLSYACSACRQYRENKANSKVRKLYARQITNLLGGVVSLVLLCYAFTIYNAVKQLGTGLCFEAVFTNTFSIYEKEILSIAWMATIIFVVKIVVVCHDFLYCAQWRHNNSHTYVGF